MGAKRGKGAAPDARRVVVFGAGGVGKSSLTVRFVQGGFDAVYDPTIEDSYTYVTKLDGEPHRLEILDTAGAEQFSVMRDMYMSKGEAFLLCYDITNRRSFSEVQDIHREICSVRNEDHPTAVLVGTKCDLEDLREVGTDLADSTARKWRVRHYLTSAKANINVPEVFHAALREILAARHRAAPKKRPRRQSGCALM